MALTIPRKRVLLCAYACEPDCGSEPGVGWGAVTGLAPYHDLIVVTRTNNREKIEAARLLLDSKFNSVQFYYYDLPFLLQRLKRGRWGIYWYYYLWQRGAANWLKRKVLPTEKVDVALHATFAVCWLPSLVARLGVPYVLGPVGGGERVPPACLLDATARFRVGQRVRVMAQNTVERWPSTRNTLRSARVILCSTSETQAWLGQHHYHNTSLFPPGWFNVPTVPELKVPPVLDRFVFISVGRLLELKGFALGLYAFARALPRLNGARYWIVGAGPQRQELERIVTQLGICEQVNWVGWRSRDETLMAMAQSHVLVHPSLHDSASWVCLEALALGKPVLALNAGAAKHQISAACGYLVEPVSRMGIVHALADAMVELANNQHLYQLKSDAAHTRFRTELCADIKVPLLARLLSRVAAGQRAA